MILKILLIILLIIAALVLMILFIPVRYRFEAHAGNGETAEKLTASSFRQDLYAAACASWLAGLLRIRYDFRDGKGKPELRILGIRVPVPAGKKNGRKKKKKPSAKKEQIRPGIRERLSQAFRLYDNIEPQVLSDTAAKLLQKGRKLVRSLLPRRLWAEGTIGTGDPADTGKIFMTAGLLSHIAGSGWRLQLEPDMDNARIRLDGGGSGRVFVFRILVFLLWFLTDRDIAAIRKARRAAAGKKEHERTEGKPLSGTDHIHDGERAERTDDPDGSR